MTYSYLATEEGNDLGGVEAKTLTACKDSCDSTSGCRSFAYGNPNGNKNCWLKDKSMTESEPATYDGYWTTYYQTCTDGKQLQSS